MMYLQKLFSMNVARTLALIIFLPLLGQCQAKQPSYSKALEEKIKEVENNLGTWVKLADTNLQYNIAARMAFYKIPGVSIAVIHHYQLEWARGYGWADMDQKRPVTNQTLFQAASISKSLNAVGLLKLVQDGKIDLSTDINHYLKSWQFPYDSLSKNKIITVANLLSHTAGLSVHGFGGYTPGDSLPSVIQILNGQHPANSPAVRSEFAPGLRFQYSGGGTTITQLILTDLTGEAYDQYQWQQVLQPMGMESSFYTQPPPAAKLNWLASAYYVDQKPVKGKFHIYPEMAPAGLWTSPTDLGHYIIETQLAYEGKSQKVLSQAMTRIRLTPVDSNSDAALGVFIDKKGARTYFQHGGANEGFRCQYYGSLTDGDGVAVMVNSDNGNIISEIINSVAQVYSWPGFYQPVTKKVVSVPRDTLDQYTGNYILGNQSNIVIRRTGDHLFLSQDGSPGMELLFTSNSDFFLFEIPADSRFERDSTGKIAKIAVKQNGGSFDIRKKD
jgi:CubicO group peptidase (beta-lactamase class C family)